MECRARNSQAAAEVVDSHSWQDLERLQFLYGVLAASHGYILLAPLVLHGSGRWQLTVIPILPGYIATVVIEAARAKSIGYVD
jgi:hypothetical protein